MLSYLHSDLLAANQSQRNPSLDSIDAALTEGRSLRKAGHFADALREFNRALALSRQSKNAEQTVRSLVLVATVELLSFRYQDALASAQEALNLAQPLQKYALAGAASGTISTVYTQLGDFQAAEREAQLAANFLRQAPAGDVQARQFLTQLLLVQSMVAFAQGKTSAGMKFSESGIAQAQQAKLPAQEALAWDIRGNALLQDGQTAAAAQALQKGYLLRQAMHDDEGLAVSREHLAELELTRPKPDYQLALQLIDQAFAANSTLFKTHSQYYPIHIRGEILLKSGHRAEALAEFRRAVDSADQWRQGALPGDTTNTQTVARLDALYKDCAHLAAAISLEKHDPKLAVEGLEILARNRAASLREQLTLAFAMDSRLPAAYFQKLGELQAAQSRVTLGRDSKEDQEDLERIRADLSNLENQIDFRAGINYFSTEKNLRKNSLRDIQSRLGNERLLLSFSLGKEKSYLWAVTGDQVFLYQLSSEDALQKRAVQFTEAVRGGSETTSKGSGLSGALFGQLPPRALQKREWLVVGDGPLLSGVPFAALPNPAGHCCEPLPAGRTLRFLPSESLLLLSPKTKPPLDRFVGIGDPIYNLADARINGSHIAADGKEASGSITLARLAGSEREIRASARQSGLADLQLLTGLNASGEELKKTLAKTPELLHFAVHVVSPPERPQEAALALSLKNGVPELLTSETIATYRVPGSLVVLSGCSSSQGKTLPSAGLQGLSRAWLLAGAAAVVVSAWPTPDDSGSFFSSFYSHLQAARKGPIAQRAALALAQTQEDMRRNGGYRSSPSFWAAYSIISKE